MASLFRGIVKVFVPITAFGAGYVLFPSSWKQNRWQQPKLQHINTDILAQIEKLDLYKQLESDADVIKHYRSAKLPQQHVPNHVGSGLLFGPHLFEVDPVVFLNEKEGEITAFYHLGSKLVSLDGRLHNGVTATILDEGLCTCGFSKLPSKMGVTANLSIDFKHQAQPDSTLVLKAKVVEKKGRKVVIEGNLSTFPFDGSRPMEIASSRCVLVEPKWFKFLRWLDL